MMFDLPGHHHVSDLFPFEQADQASQLANTHPLDLAATLVYLGRSLFLDCGNHHLYAALARTLEYQEWESAVACNQPVLHD